MASYYASSSGNDANDGLSIVNAKTLQGCLELTFSNNDIIYVLDDGVHVLAATPTLATSNSIVGLRGANSLGELDGSKPIIRDNTGLIYLLNIASNQTILFISNLIFDGNNNTTTALVRSNRGNINIINCDFINSLGTGFLAVSSTSFYRLINCKAYNNGAIGLYSAFCYNCASYNNGSDGFFGGNIQWENCISYGNVGAGFSTYGVTAGGIIRNCIADNNDLYGFRVGRYCDIVNSIATRNGNQGFFNYDNGYPHIALNCLAGSGAWANTSGAFSSYVQQNCLTDDPKFKDADAGDYSIEDATSPLIEAGLIPPMLIRGSYLQDIGLTQRLIAALGGGLLVHPGMAGGFRA